MSACGPIPPPQGGIRASPYETGVYFVPPEPGSTLQSIGTQQWVVGTRYALEKVIGYGSFSCVCRARDLERGGSPVAIKRIGDVLQSPEQARRVLREICIQRRCATRVPGVVRLLDVWTRPSATGSCVLRGGAFVNLSVDVYLVIEYAEGGDLFGLRGQMTEGEARDVAAQVLVSLRALHALNVWHRDVKSQNVFLFRDRNTGRRIAKLGDFGSARSATPAGYHHAEQPPAHRSRRIDVLVDRAEARRKASLAPPSETAMDEDGGASPARADSGASSSSWNASMQGAGGVSPSHSGSLGHPARDASWGALRNAARDGSAQGTSATTPPHSRAASAATLRPHGRNASQASVAAAPFSAESATGGVHAQRAPGGPATAARPGALLPSTSAATPVAASAAATPVAAPAAAASPSSPPLPHAPAPARMAGSPEAAAHRRSSDADAGTAPSSPPCGRTRSPAPPRPAKAARSQLTLRGGPAHLRSQAAAHEARAEDLTVQVDVSGGGGLKGPLTRMVATPCYRAPEVVMSRGGYTSSIDMWSVGCIFGELLQRVIRVGSANTPSLQVAPLFAVRGLARTPNPGDHFRSRPVGAEPTAQGDDGDLVETPDYGLPSSEMTRRELSALFDAVGTPAWADIAAIPMRIWREYLGRLPGRAPTLWRRFGHCGEPAVDLLSRLLAFDPVRRASADEALMHEYFDPWRASHLEDGRLAEPLEALPGEAVDEDTRVAAFEAAAEASQVEAGELLPTQLQYWNERNVGRALDMLEAALELVAPNVANATADSPGCQRLRRLLEAEVAAQRAESDVIGRAEPAGSGSEGPRASSQRSRHATGTRAEETAYPAAHAKGLIPDVSAVGGLEVDADVARLRLNNVADTWQGVIDPENFLRPNRHGTWTALSGQGPAPGPAWGVDVLPPGECADPQMEAVMRQQQGR